MNEQRIREIANESSYHAENSVDYYSGIVDGLTWEAKILKARDLKFAELIVRECEKSIKSVPTHFEAQDKIIVECLKAIRETFRS